MDDTYGLLASRFATKHDLAGIEAKLNELYQKPASSRNTRQIAKLMQARDAILAKAAAKKGAMLAAASIPGLAGGLASSGIRGMDVVEHEFTPQVMRDYNVDGAAQGLRQMSVAPPGSGRLVAIPFVAAGAVVPVHILTGSGAAGVGATTNLVTNSVNWAVLRIVALITQVNAPTATDFGVMQDFRIGGSPNLFLPEDWVLMDDYDTDKEQYAGLRAYPIMISPNTALISVANSCMVAAFNTSIYASIAVVTEVLRDDAFGPGLPGAYAR